MDSADQLRPALRPPQFGLRTMWVAMTLCGGLFALTQWLPPASVAAIGFLLLAIGGHVAGNLLGTRLRQHADDHGVAALAPASGRRRPVQTELFAPTTQLGQTSPLGWPLLAGTLAGIVAGGIAGGYSTLVFSSGETAELNLVVGIVAYGVLGGIGSFVGFGFLFVGGSAISQSLRGGPKQAAAAPAAIADPAPRDG